MKKITITIILAMLMALMVSPALAAVNVATVQYDGACTTSTVAVSSGTVSVVLTAVKDFNITYSGESAGAVTITIDANSFDIIRTAVPVINIVYTGDATACTAAIATDTLTLTRDANATNTTYDLTNANYNTIAEVVAAIAARDDFNCTVYGTTYNAFTSADLVDMEATSCKTALDLTFSGTQTWDITNAAYNTRGEMITALSAVTDITIVEWDGDDDSVATAFVDVSTQDITTLFTVTTTNLTYTVATYKTFGNLKMLWNQGTTYQSHHPQTFMFRQDLKLSQQHLLTILGRQISKAQQQHLRQAEQSTTHSAHITRYLEHLTTCCSVCSYDNRPNGMLLTNQAEQSM